MVATVKHGDRLEVIETRRRFVKVRTAGGVEGWTDVNLLLSERQMSDLRRLAASAAKLPSQGAATVYEPLNIHAEPYRQSASFFQIPEGGSVEVIGHRITPHGAPPPAPKPVAVHRAGPPKKAKPKAQVSPLRPPPPPPRSSANWLELSRPRLASRQPPRLPPRGEPRLPFPRPPKTTGPWSAPATATPAGRCRACW